MSKPITFEGVNNILAGFVHRGPNNKRAYNLGRMLDLMSHLGNPQNTLRVIHVAGTSGKTSTSYYITAMLELSGHKVGLTVSPHVSEVNERLQINLKPLNEKDYCRVFSEFLEIIEKSRIQPTYFEFLVAMAYWYFAKEKVDYAVIEVGLGGLLDGTNVIERRDKVAVITDIGLDHTNVLGNDISDIAAQKAGIIGDHNAIFTHHQSAEALVAINNRCKQQHAQLFLVDEDDYLTAAKKLPLFQQRNWTLAKEVVEYVRTRDGFEVSEGIYAESAKTYIPGRMEVIKRGGKFLVLDGAHNPQKLESLHKSLVEKFPNKDIAVLVALAGHKEQFDESLQEITKFAKHLILTSFRVKQDEQRSAVNPRNLAAVCDVQGFKSYEVIDNPRQALMALLNRPEQLLLITGSLYLISVIRGEPGIMKR